MVNLIIQVTRKW